MASCCGLDFGTSNSCVALDTDNGPALVPVEGDAVTIPSAIFFSFETDRPTLGRKAIADYVDGEHGRLMRAIKSIIGSDLINQTTPVGRRRVSFTQVIGLFLSHLKRAAEERCGREIESVVLGRPVEFVGAADAAQQAQAAQSLIDIARDQSFRHIETQFEPIAAALHYEAGINAEELVLVVDIGGGTSDFSVVRVSPERKHAPDRGGDILGNSGARLGGTNFDQRLSLQKVMPLFGFRSMVRKEMGEDYLEAPRAIYMDLSMWHRIMFAYTRDNLQTARSLKRLAVDERLFSRLETLLEHRLAHQAAEMVERAKIRLSDESDVAIDLSFVEAGLSCDADRKDFEAASMETAEGVIRALDAVLAASGVRRDAIDAVFMTGGSSNIPLLKAMVKARLPAARMTFGDMFGSVGKGLALDARRKFS